MCPYPAQAIRVSAFNDDLAVHIPQPADVADWPLVQIKYLSIYLAGLGCRTVVEELHYVDRDFIDDVSRFYSRNLRSYANYCTRLHFFSDAFDDAAWKEMIRRDGVANHAATSARLQASYLGFTILRPLPGSPIGRTVLKTVGPRTNDGLIRTFDPTRTYDVHLGGFDLEVLGLAFQQQDQGVSACATTALWTALHSVANKEGGHIPTPSEITEAASRYLLADGRAMPSEGLRVEQICEATRAAGLAPLVVRSLSPDEDRAQLSGYVRSGFAPVLAVNIAGTGHAVCCVGLKLGHLLPQTDPDLHFRDAASRIRGIYAHDDRLGPYASVQIHSRTTSTGVRTGLLIRWPDGVEEKDALLHSMVVPLPPKIRLSVTRMRALGLTIAAFAGKSIPGFGRNLTLDTRYELGVDYKRRAFAFGLSGDGLFQLQCELAMSRYLGLIEITTPDEPLLDVLLDTTEAGANPFVLAYVQHRAMPSGMETRLKTLAATFGGQVFV
jgi:hypothetical protein